MKRLFLRSRLVVVSALFIPLLTLRFTRADEAPITEMDPLQADVLNLIEFRVDSLEAFEGYRERLEQKLPLTGQQLHDLHYAVVDNQEILSRLIKYVKANDSILNTEPETLAPADRLRYITVLGVSFSLADTYLQTLSLYHNDKNLRRVLNEPDSVYGKPKKFLRWCIRTLLKRKHVKRYARGAVSFMTAGTKMVFSAGEQAAADFWKTLVERSYLLTLISENTTASDEAAIEQEKGSKNELDELDEMDETVSESPSAKFQKKIVQALRFKHVGMKDFLYSLKMGAFGQISKAFGNTVGMVQFRKGKLYHRKDVEADISSNLRPGDILLERTPFRLTDFFIPGYFGHAAIWMGTEAELKELGIWEHPTIVPLHDKIRSGASIVQALRPGTIISPVMDFLDIDDFAVIRKRDPLSREELKDALIATATQVGKKYDFNFDVATQNTLVCSELVYIAYMKIEWRTEKSMGRNTINPDAVAERGEPGKEFDVIHLYVGGMKQTGDLSAKMKYVLDHAKQKDKKILRGLGSIE